MSDWFQHNHPEEENGKEAPPQESAVPHQETAGGADSYTTADSSSTESKNGADSASGQNAPSSWQAPSGWSTPGADSSSGPQQPAGGAVPPPAASSWQSPSSWGSASNANPQRPYVPGGQSYNPYGWQQPAYNTPNGGGGAPSPQPPKKKKSAGGILIGVLGGICAVTIVTLSVLLAMAWDDKGTPGTSHTGTTSTGDSSSHTGNPDGPKLQINDLEEGTTGLSTRDIVKKNLDSTVVITIYDTASTGTFGGESLGVAGGATGIVMSQDGYIITNWHCVVNENTKKKYPRIDVTTYDGTVYENAQVVGYDEATDLAVIRVGAVNLSPAEFGDSTSLELGDRVVAIGNAGGLEWTVTQGVVSGLARDVYDDTGYAIKCLQVDAAINPGNSGGPLLNAAGQVIAVNSAKIVAEGYEGLGFSIPINEAKRIIDDLIEYGYVKGRVSLGITGYSITQPDYKGFMIESINADSPLAGSGAQRGDLITHVNDVRVNSYGEMRSELAKYKVGDQVTLTLLRIENRQDRSFDITVTLGEAKG